MSSILWVIQIILGIKFISAAYTHGLRQEQTIMEGADYCDFRFVLEPRSSRKKLLAVLNKAPDIRPAEQDKL
jgi:hypothetical protein